MQPHIHRALLGVSAAIGLAATIRLIIARPKLIVAPVGAPVAVREAHRRIAFAGAGNFRDLGGYRTVDGRALRWGALYRSGDLHRLTDHDLIVLNALGLAVLVDFRADFEKAVRPNRLPPGDRIKVVELPIFDAHSALGAQLRERISRGDIAGLDPVAFLLEANRQFVTEFTPVFRQFIEQVLAAEGRPVLFHCTGGKDRTGFAAAIILRLLGVPETTIMADYMLSKGYSLRSYRRDILIVRLLRGRRAAAIVRKLVAVEPTYLQAAFAAIEQQYGSFAAYVRDGLALSDEQVEQLGRYLLEGRA